jgi:hypothetical protein
LLLTSGYNDQATKFPPKQPFSTAPLPSSNAKNFTSGLQRMEGRKDKQPDKFPDVGYINALLLYL